MKILAISHEFPPIGGGGANACNYLTRGFVENGHEVTLVTANFQELPTDEVCRGVHIIRVNSKRAHQEHCSFMEMLDFICKAWTVADRLCKSEKFDVCLIFFGIPSGPIGYLLKKKYGIPYVIRFGGGDIPGFQERFTKVYKLIAPAIKVIWKNADRLVANSEGLQQLAYGFYDKKSVDIITNGIDTTQFTPKERKRDKISILFVSRLIERKGLQFVIPQLKKVLADVNQEIELVIVGDGPYKEELVKITEENKLSEIVRFEGQKDKKAVVEYCQNADIFILPSKKEGMPNVVLEAMACGLPIIMTPCEGSKELVKANGYVVPVDRFSDKLIELCNDEEERKEFGLNSRNVVVESFSWDSIVEQYIKEFESVL